MQRDYPCPRCNTDEGSPICLQDERCTGALPPMTVDDFFAEAKRLNLRMLGTPEETRAALDMKDAEIERLRAALSAILERVNQPSFGMGRDIRAMTEAALGPNAEVTGRPARAGPVD